MIPSNIKALILDMDGVIWKGDAPIGDLAAIFKRIRERGLKFAFATNNGTKTPEDYQKILAGFGVDVGAAQIVTSALGIAFMLSQKYPRGTKIFVIGEEGIRVALEEKGFEVVGVEDAPQAEAVVMGIDRSVNFQKIAEATLLVRAGRPFYTTNTDRTFPTPRGEIPGSGAWVSVVSMATRTDPIVAGKPFPYLMELALERLGTLKEETLVVGDRLETDIAAGQAVGCPTALVLSGVGTREEAKDWNNHCREFGGTGRIKNRTCFLQVRFLFMDSFLSRSQQWLYQQC
ncbi:MAG: HAD-IIA family hydrolase [Chloroflexi bacterium CFX2]|nr:HAD-IIA family hydrolase [Chloroflexi bacterium CFX2]